MLKAHLVKALIMLICCPCWKSFSRHWAPSVRLASNHCNSTFIQHTSLPVPFLTSSIVLHSPFHFTGMFFMMILYIFLLVSLSESHQLRPWALFPKGSNYLKSTKHHAIKKKDYLHDFNVKIKIPLKATSYPVYYHISELLVK